MWWWENPFPNYDSDIPWTRHEIKNSGANTHHDQIFGDFNADGQDELVFWNQGAKKLFIANIPEDPQNTQPWSFTEIYSWSSGDEHEGLAKVDIDGDGQIDIVGGGRWFKHNGGTSYTANIIDDSQRFTRVAAGQLKEGGRPEVVFVAGDGTGRLKWYEWNGMVWEGHDLLGFDLDHGHSLEIADINGDGYLDIFVAEMRLNGENNYAKTLIFLGDGNGNFTQTEVVTGFGNHESKVSDLDGDGDLDILGKPYNWDTPRVDIWINDGASTGLVLPLDRWERHVVDSDKPWRTLFVTSADVDGDSQKDIITGGWWYRNPGNPGDTWIRNTIGIPLNNMAAVYDFDGDGDVDVLGTEGQGSEVNDSFVWARNNGSGLFTIFNNISNADGDFLQGTEVGYFQTDGALSVILSWHDESTDLQSLTVPSDPVNENWNWNPISNISQWEDLSAGDIDEDGHLDLLLGTKWLRNENDVWNPYEINDTTDRPDRNRLADLNGDGRLDAVVGFEAISQPGKLAWYEQGSSPTSAWTEHVIATVIGPMSLDVSDMDGDGDIDVVLGEHNISDPASAKLYVFENTDGQGVDWTKHVVYMGDEHHDGAQIVDIDGDGDLDIISIGWTHGRVLLYENKAINIEPYFPPAIITQPLSQTITEGQTATFTITAEGNEPLSYQWQKDGTDISGANSSTYTTPATTLDDNGATFVCVVTNDQGNIASDTAILTVEAAPVPPAITTQPLSQTVTEGQTATFSIVAEGTEPLSYQWQKDGTAISAANSSTYTTPATTLDDNGATFVCVVTNDQGNIASDTATLTVEAPVPPAITTQPLSQTVTEGQTATFSIVAEGTEPLSYQWQKDGTAISGANSSTYTTPATTLDDNGTTFVCVVTNDQGNIASDTATLTVEAPVPPAITTQPLSQTVTEGQTATFSIVAEGTEPLSYQWQKDGTAISGANSSTYTTPATTLDDNGTTFVCVVTNDQGNIASDTATLTVEAPVPPAITTQPLSQTVTEGQTATFSIVAEGTEPLSYQWQKDGTAISAANSSTYTTPATTLDDNGTTFVCVVTNDQGNIASDTATLTVEIGAPCDYHTASEPDRYRRPDRHLFHCGGRHRTVILPVAKRRHSHIRRQLVHLHHTCHHPG